MKAVILAAGIGKRMRPLTRNLPKPLIKIAGKTFLDHIFDSLPKQVDTVIVVVGYKADQIKKYLGSFYKERKVRYVLQKKLDGTAGALLVARSLLQEGRFLVFYGDELPRASEVKKMMLYRYSVLCHKINKPIPTGVLNLDSRGRILKIIEKREKIKPPATSTGGVMLIDENIFKYKPVRHSNGEVYLSSMLNKFLRKHPVYAVMGPSDLYFITKDDVDKANKILYKS